MIRLSKTHNIKKFNTHFDIVIDTNTKLIYNYLIDDKMKFKNISTIFKSKDIKKIINKISDHIKWEKEQTAK